MQASDGQGFFLPKVINEIRLRYVWLVAAAIIGLSMSVIYAYNAPTIYSAEALVILEARQSLRASDEKIGATYNSDLDNAKADSQMQIIKSERLLRSVFVTLDLKNAPEFRAVQKRNLFARFQDYLSNDSSSDKNQEKDATTEELAFQNFSARVGTRRIGQSYVIALSFVASDAVTAAKMANAIAMEFIKQQISMRYAAALASSEYLQGRLESFKNQLNIANSSILQDRIPNELLPDADARVITAASPPMSASAPRKFLICALGTFAALAIAVLLIVILASINDTLYTPRQLSSEFDLEDFGTLRVGSQDHGSWRISGETVGQIVKKCLNDSRNQRVLSDVRLMCFSNDTKVSALKIGIVCVGSELARRIFISSLAIYMAIEDDIVIQASEDNTEQASNRIPTTVEELKFHEALHASLRKESCHYNLENITLLNYRSHGQSLSKLDDHIRGLYDKLNTNRGHKVVTIVDMRLATVSSDYLFLKDDLDTIVIMVERGLTNVGDVRTILRRLGQDRSKVTGFVFVT